MPVVMVVPWLGPRMISGSRKSFQIHTPRKISTLAVAGRSSGKTIRQNTWVRVAPSIAAASSSSTGMVHEAGEHEHSERDVVADIEQDQPLHSGHQVSCPQDLGDRHQDHLWRD